MKIHRPTTAATAVYNEASGIYWQSFGPLTAVAGAVGLAFNLILFVKPGFFVSAIGWYLFVNFVGVAMIASAMLVPMIVAVRNKQTSSGVPTHGVREHGWHIAAATFLLVLGNGILVYTVIGIVAAAYLTVRFAFIAAASTIEDSDISDSIARSWEITKGMWARTGRVLLGAVAPAIVLFTVLSLLAMPWYVDALAIVATEALVAPFFAAVVVIVFDELRASNREPQESGPPLRPPPA